MKTLTTYHNDPKFKRDFVRMTRLHREQDRYISGQYQIGEGETFGGVLISIPAGVAISSVHRSFASWDAI